MQEILTDLVAKEESRIGIERCQSFVHKLAEFGYVVRETRLDLGIVGDESKYCLQLKTAIDFLKQPTHFVHSYRLIVQKNNQTCTIHAKDEQFENLSVHHRNGSREDFGEELDQILKQKPQ